MQGLGYKRNPCISGWRVSVRGSGQDPEKKIPDNFAKRQLTWFRREKDTIWMNKDEFDYNEDRILDEMLKVCRDRGIL